MKRFMILFGTLLLSLGFIVGCGEADNEDDQSIEEENVEEIETNEEDVQEETGHEVPEEEPQEGPPETLDEYLDWVVMDELGEETNHSEDEYINRIAEFAHVEGEEGQHDVYLTLVGDDNLSDGMIVRNMHTSTINVLKRVYEERDDVENINFEWQFPMVLSGEEGLLRIMLIAINKETYDAVDWDNFVTDDLPTLYEYYYLHPAFK